MLPSAIRKLTLVLGALASLAALIGCPQQAPEASIYAGAIEQLEQFIEEELERGLIPGVSIALVDDQEIVWTRGFGLADREDGIAADAQTIYRVGSISKLFTDMGVMRLVEAGSVDLDADIATYYPDFSIGRPFETDRPTTLRQLMSHTSGFPREPPVGSYFDDTEPTVRETVESIFDTELVYLPETRTKYSNIAVTVVGHILELVSGEPFVDYQREHLLGPMGMTSSDFLATPEIRERLATGYMWVADGRNIAAPLFELGTLPAGNLYSTVEDQGRFLSFIFAEGRAGDNQIMEPETLERMFEAQFSTEEHPRRFGLGFVLGEFRGHRAVGHTGAVFGFTSAVTALPDEKIGVVVLVNEDIATGPLYRIRNRALELMLEAKLGEAPPEPPRFVEVDSGVREDYAGEYESQMYWAEVGMEDGMLVLNLSGQPMELLPLSESEYFARGKLVEGASVTFVRDDEGTVTGFRYNDMGFARVDPAQTPTPSSHWEGYVGSYGQEFIPVIVSIRHGHLYVFVENEFDYRLTPVSEALFDMPSSGMYQDQQFEFRLDGEGNVESIVMACVVFEPIEY